MLLWNEDLREIAKISKNNMAPKNASKNNVVPNLMNQYIKTVGETVYKTGVSSKRRNLNGMWDVIRIVCKKYY